MEEPQSKTCQCFFVADNVLNKQRLTLGRIMTSVHIKTPYFSHFSRIKYWKRPK